MAKFKELKKLLIKILYNNILYRDKSIIFIIDFLIYNGQFNLKILLYNNN